MIRRCHVDDYEGDGAGVAGFEGGDASDGVGFYPRDGRGCVERSVTQCFTMSSGLLSC